MNKPEWRMWKAVDKKYGSLELWGSIDGEVKRIKKDHDGNTISEAPAPTALISESFTFKLNRSMASKPTQLLEAPVSKINCPFTPLIDALISK